MNEKSIHTKEENHEYILEKLDQGRSDSSRQNDCTDSRGDHRHNQRNESDGIIIRTQVQPDTLILKSSTSGSKKKFKITVDDSGAITATEMT